MALLYLLDTNVVSELTKPAPNPGVMTALRELEARSAISAITLEELCFGCARLQSSERRVWLNAWLERLATRMPVLPYDAQAARWLGPERARLQRLGKPAPRTDGEVAAVAVTQGLILVTHNQADFANFQGLQVQDWHG